MGGDLALLDWAILLAVVTYLVVSFSRQYVVGYVAELLQRYWKWRREAKWIERNRY